MGLSLSGVLKAAGRQLVGAADDYLGTSFLSDYDAQKNFDLQKSKLSWDQAVQRETWNREDTAVQRRVKDLQAAGMNPLLAATGQGASSGAVVSTTAPQRVTLKLDPLEKIAARASIDKTVAETAVAGATKQNLEEQNENIKVQNDLIKAQTIKTIADATGWTTEEVALKLFGFGWSSVKKKPNKDVKSLKFSDDPSRNDYYHNYLDNFTKGSVVNPV